MRTKFAQSIIEAAKNDNKMIFLTGDLGFRVLEGIREELGEKFINAGVAEQNMVTMAAGLAYAGFRPWVYSIAPFITIKALEELRDDICLNNLNVKIVGPGGGFDYETAGPTHHALQDIGTLLTLPNMKVYAPAFAEDIEAVVNKMINANNPGYLRLVKARSSVKGIKYAPYRNIYKGKKMIVVVLGSIIDKVIKAVEEVNNNKNLIDLWLVSELPSKVPGKLLESIKKIRNLCVIEEHVETGGLGQYISTVILKEKIGLKSFIHLFVNGYLSKKIGSRDFYLKENGLDEVSIARNLRKSL